MTSRRASSRPRWIWWTLLAVLVVLGAFATVSGLRAAQAARTLQADVAAATGHARSLQMDQLVDAVPVISADAEAFSASVSGPFWSVMAHVPVIGSTVSSARDMADAAVAASSAAQDLVPVLPLLDTEKIRGRDGALDLGAMQKVADALAAAQPDLELAAASAQSADAGAIGPVGDAVSSAQEQLTALPETAATATGALELSVQLLGRDRPQRWMVILQNGSEARGTGGFLGAYGLVRADDGVLDVTTVDTNNSLSTPIPNRDMPREFLDLWSKEYTSEWNSYNLSRHFPYTGQLSANGMKVRGTPIDNVIALDAHVVAGLMAGTGPITAGTDVVTADNAERFFNADIYTKYPDTAAKDRAVVALMNGLLEHITTGSFDAGAALNQVLPLMAQDRVSLWSAEPDLQDRIDGFSVSSQVPDTPGPWTAVAMNNSAANKLDAFVASSVDYRAATCGTGYSTVTVTLTNNSPAGGIGEAFSDTHYQGGSRGNTRMWTAVYGPVGAEFASATIDGKKQFVQEGEERGHPVWRWNIDLPQGTTSVLEVRFTEPRSDADPIVWPQAMAVPQDTSAVRDCR